MSRLEIHIPISPTPSFVTMVHYFAATLRRYSGRFKDAWLVASVGEDCDPFDIGATQPQLARHDITWRWANRDDFRRNSYNATGLTSRAMPFEVELVMIADAAPLVMGDFSDAAEQLARPFGIAAVPATWPPWLGRGKGDVDRIELFALAGLPTPVFDCPHLGHGVYYPVGAGMDAGPAYFSYGVVLGTRDAMSAIASTVPANYFLAVEFLRTDLAAQVGSTLSIIRSALTYRALPVRYSFSADYRAHEVFPAETADVLILHYLNCPFRKHVNTASPSAVATRLKDHRDDQGAHAQFIFNVVNRADNAVVAESADSTA